jgi:hypothetical protein
MTSLWPIWGKSEVKAVSIFARKFALAMDLKCGPEPSPQCPVTIFRHAGMRPIRGGARDATLVVVRRQLATQREQGEHGTFDAWWPICLAVVSRAAEGSEL